MIITTNSSAELEKVKVEVAPSGLCSDVWLRRDIRRDTADFGPNPEKAVEVWRAEEVHYVCVGTPSVEEVEASFDALWAEHENDGLSDSERIVQIEQRQADTEAALLELGDMIGGEQ